MELKSYAKKNSIELFDAKTKLEILEILASWIPPKPVVLKKEEEKKPVALYSTKNIFWNGIGQLKIGYNIVSEKEAERWVTRSAVRKATPEEVASYYGK